MILGVGTDLVEISRIERACRKDHFVKGVFTDRESRQAMGSASKLAGSFAGDGISPLYAPRRGGAA